MTSMTAIMSALPLTALAFAEELAPQIRVEYAVAAGPRVAKVLKTAPPCSTAPANAVVLQRMINVVFAMATALVVLDA